VIHRCREKRSESVVTVYEDYEMRFLITRNGMGRQENNGVCCVIQTMALLMFFQGGGGYARMDYTMESVEACYDYC
jgi:molybdopterin biosynthesis enzyme MoaB